MIVGNIMLINGFIYVGPVTDLFYVSGITHGYVVNRNTKKKKKKRILTL